MITKEVMKGLWQRLYDVLKDVVLDCDIPEECGVLQHTIPLDVFRDNPRINIAVNENLEEKTDGKLPQIARTILDPVIIGRKFKNFLGGIVTDSDGNEVGGSWRKCMIVLNFYSTDWYDLFGKDIAWKMAEDAEGYIFNVPEGIWDEYLGENGAVLLRKDYHTLDDKMKKIWGIENVYHVQLGFEVVDQREWKTPPNGGVPAPPEDIFEEAIFDVYEVSEVS